MANRKERLHIREQTLLPWIIRNAVQREHREHTHEYLADSYETDIALGVLVALEEGHCQFNEVSVAKDEVSEDVGPSHVVERVLERMQSLEVLVPPKRYALVRALLNCAAGGIELRVNVEVIDHLLQQGSRIN